MNDLNHNDLSLLAAALRGFIHNSDKAIDYYVDECYATMLLSSMKEQRHARELLKRVMIAEDRFYEEEDGE